MPRRQVVFQNGEFYHIFNKTIGGLDVFACKRNNARALSLIDFYRFPQPKRYSHFRYFAQDEQKKYLEKVKQQKPLVEIHAFCLMPNHFHFLLKQVCSKGIVKFTANFQNGFAKYFNLKNKRSGGLFNHMFKAARVEDENQLLHLSRYIHLNPVTAYLIKIEELVLYPYTSFSFYLGNIKNDLVTRSMLKSYFKKEEQFKNFVFDQADYQKKIAGIKALLLENKSRNFFKKTRVWS